MREEIKVLRDQLSISRQENTQLGSRAVPVEPEEAMALREEVARDIKRRRGIESTVDKDVTLDEMRADGKAKIDQFIKDYKWLLTPWTRILDSLLAACTSYYFDHLSSVGDFIDGFMLNVGPNLSSAQVERFLKDQGLDVFTPL